MYLLIGIALIFSALSKTSERALPVWPTPALHKKISRVLDVLQGLSGASLVICELFFPDFGESFYLSFNILIFAAILALPVYIGFFIKEKRIPRKYVIRILNSVAMGCGVLSTLLILLLAAVGEPSSPELRGLTYTLAFGYPIVLIALIIYADRKEKLLHAAIAAVLATLPLVIMTALYGFMYLSGNL